ncbi:MAG: hypothetical protein ACU85V_15425 [Gammaproteobacteria bacterium]
MSGESRTEEAARLQAQVGGEVVENTVGTFEHEEVYSETLSAAAGEPVTIGYDYCHERVPGNMRANNRAIVRKHFPDGRVVMVAEWFTRRYPMAWDAFLRGEDLAQRGTLLEDCPAVPKNRLMALKAAQIRTVEELIALPDASLPRIGHDGRALVKAAQQWVEENDGQARMAERLAELEAELAAMKEKNADGDDLDGGAERSRGARARKAG